MALSEFLKKFFKETPIIIIQPDGTKLKATVEQTNGEELKVTLVNPLPICMMEEYGIEVITAHNHVTVLAEEGGVEYSAAIDVKNAKSIFLTIINHTAVHNLQAIILTSYDGVHFDSEDTSAIVLTVDVNDEQESCAIAPGMAYLKVGLLKHFAGDTTGSSILMIRK